MPESKTTKSKTSKSDERHHHDGGFRGPRPFWSGTIAFGLVNLPVGLYPAQHSRDITLKEVDDQGRPLSRRFFSETGRKPLKSSELARGVEVGEDRYAVVEDQEIEDATLEHRREIELSRFVPLDQLDPLYFRRAYFLVPDSRSARGDGALKPYRLLAAAMENAGRAGIATLVMRGREVLVAIVAENGILRAEALRFHDELRTPRSIGLEPPGEPDAKRERRIRQAMDKLDANHFDPDELIDPHIEALKKRVRQKRRRHQDVAPVEATRSRDADQGNESEEGAEVIDLMQVLKRSLKRGRVEPTPKGGQGKGGEGKGGEDKGGEGKGRASKRKSSSSARASDTQDKASGRSPASRKSRRAPAKAELTRLSREALYQLAQQRDLAGRSGMNKMQLIEALRQGD
ncbi:Ku protein [uncultured Salinicola sp.]|uniref:non-homologous end joining protein Ku n=1 Tax=uncultured Salinicola sp. TaxID=1193542 RepID=UPI0026025252|nr:Ku protein [uncultured Salinicola sp.]